MLDTYSSGGGTVRQDYKLAAQLQWGQHRASRPCLLDGAHLGASQAVRLSGRPGNHLENSAASGAGKPRVAWPGCLAMTGLQHASTGAKRLLAAHPRFFCGPPEKSRLLRCLSAPKLRQARACFLMLSSNRRHVGSVQRPPTGALAFSAATKAVEASERCMCSLATTVRQHIYPCII